MTMQAWFIRLPAITELALIVLAAWLVSGWLLQTDPVEDTIKPAPVNRESASPDINQLLDVPLFGSAKKTEPVQAAKTAVPSKLNIKLVGTVVAGDRSAAMVTTGSGAKQRLVFVGDTMQSGVVLKSVEVDAIVVDHAGKLERIELQKNKAGADAFGANRAVAGVGRSALGTIERNVDRGNLQSQIRDFPKLLSQARVTPHFVNGKSDGFVISAIQPGSLYQQIGLQNGDIIRKVNGQAITDPAQAMEMYKSLQNAPSVDLELVRAGKEQRINYVIQ